VSTLHLAKNFQFVRSPHFATGHYPSLVGCWWGVCGDFGGAVAWGWVCQRVYCTFVARQTYNFFLREGETLATYTFTSWANSLSLRQRRWLLFFLFVFLIPDFKRRTKNSLCHKNKRDAVYFRGGVCGGRRNWSGWLTVWTGKQTKEQQYVL